MQLSTGARTNPQKLGRCQQCCEPSGSGCDLMTGVSRQTRKREEERAGRRAGKQAQQGPQTSNRQTQTRRTAKGEEQSERGTEKGEERKKRETRKEAEASDRQNPTRRPFTGGLPHPGKSGGLPRGWQRVRPANCAATPPTAGVLTWHASGVSPHLGTGQ